MLKRFLILALALIGLMLGAAGRANAEPLVAYASGNILLRFDSAAPNAVTSTAITGLQPLEGIRGIDFRPATGQLYALTSQSRLYTVNVLTGLATFASNLSTPLAISSGFHGVDFNPVSDRLRVVGASSDQNLRINVDTGETITDGSINPATRRILASAYTNNFAGATSTTLYGIDAMFVGIQSPGSLVIQDANSGAITAVGSLGLGFDPSGFTNFDISGQTGIAYITTRNLNGPGGDRLFTVNLTTGQATLVGLIGDGNFFIEGLAAPVGASTAPIPEPTTLLLLGTGLAGVAAKISRRRQGDGDQT